eukprot:TRINITY_DN12464_c0_g1_i1.p1 TRINITY_DN12464_c0_g1~~TRINITY_DN12464_c0_g1_i1.p1  ORF type:complete len:817 (+),score=167.81 TRINITY_DN12464_c0_g1_i1:39-2489(+)
MAHMGSLPRGGCVVSTKKAGNIQFVMPPETVKDAMLLKIETPEHYVFPDRRFDKSNGLNLAEFEFPSYLNFFIKKRQTNLICSPKGETVIRRVFQETLFGPEVIDNDDEFPPSYPKEDRPDLRKELNYFRRNPFKTSELLQIETVLRFTHFNDKGVATLCQGVQIIKNDTKKEYSVYEDDQLLCSVPMFADIDAERSVMVQHEPQIVFDPPVLGVTMLGTSHGFDPIGNTTGMVLWINGRGILVDPPPHSNVHLRRNHVPASLIDAIILSHCHADHDAGTFQKIIEESKVVVLTTKTIMDSFLRKYSAITDLPQKFLRTLFEFRPVRIGERVQIRGAELEFFYSLHSIPCIGFELYYENRSLVFSGDTCNDAPRIRKMCEEGILSRGRSDRLINFPWHHDLILHEAGIPPLHTPFSAFGGLSDEIKSRLHLVHVAASDVPSDNGLKAAKSGVEHTLRLSVARSRYQSAISMIDLFSSIELFQCLTLPYASRLLQYAIRREIGRGGAVVEQGAPGDTFFIISSGEVAVEIDGQRAGNKIFTTGDYFGEISVFTGDRRTASIVSLTDVVVYEFSGSTLLHILQGTPVVQRLQHVAQMRQMQSWGVLSNNPVLCKLTASQKTQLQAIMHAKTVNAGEVLWSPGKPIQFIVVVASAHLKLTRSVTNSLPTSSSPLPRPLFQTHTNSHIPLPPGSLAAELHTFFVDSDSNSCNSSSSSSPSSSTSSNTTNNSSLSIPAEKNTNSPLGRSRSYSHSHAASLSSPGTGSAETREMKYGVHSETLVVSTSGLIYNILLSDFVHYLERNPFLKMSLWGESYVAPV